MKAFVFEQLYSRGYISEATFLNIAEKEKNKPVPVHAELKLMMYAGIVLLTTRLGIVVYKNIDSLGHLTIVSAIAIATVSCFAFCIRQSIPFSRHKVPTANLLNDYMLLLACMLLLILTGYLQFQYHVFGDRWGMATFMPMIVLFVCAYYFDHLGVLSMSIVNLAAWAGITVTPRHLLRNNDFNNGTLICTALALGLLLLFISFVSVKKNFKAHFSFTYKNFGVHILFIAAVAAVIHFSMYELGWLLALAAIAIWQFMIARRERSFYFLTISLLYFYFGLSYVVIRRLLTFSMGDGTLYAAFLYFIITAVLSVAVLMHYNNILKRHDHLQ